MRKLTYLGHSAFLIEKDWDGILIDPFITGNPSANFDFKKKRITCIIVTHAHLDHLGDASGQLKFSWGSVRFLPAIHSSSNPDLPYGGLAASLILDIDGTIIYHAGDTSLMSEFSLIGELYNPYYALLPIGGYYTMDIKEAAAAAKMLYAMEVIPMHYNTFPNIKANVQEFSDLLEAQGQKCLPLKPNEYVEL